MILVSKPTFFRVKENINFPQIIIYQTPIFKIQNGSHWYATTDIMKTSKTGLWGK